MFLSNNGREISTIPINRRKDCESNEHQSPSVSRTSHSLSDNTRRVITIRGSKGVAITYD
jgi:hypothetical protein